MNSHSGIDVSNIIQASEVFHQTNKIEDREKTLDTIVQVMHRYPLWFMPFFVNYMVPTWTGKPGKMGKTFSTQGKVRGFWTDWKSQGIIPKILEKWGLKYWKSEENLAIFFYFPWFFNWSIFVNNFLYLLNSLNKTPKILENGKQNTGKSQGNLWVRKCGNHG